MDGDWVQLLTRHSTDYHPRGPDKFLYNGTVCSMTWPSSHSKLLAPNWCSVSCNCPAKIWTYMYESQPFIYAWGGEKAKYTCPSSILRFLWPSGMSSGIAQFYETISLMRTTTQNPRHNWAELDVTRTWIISHSIPNRGKAAKPIGGVVNDCTTLTSMKALMVRHYLSERTAGYQMVLFPNQWPGTLIRTNRGHT